MQFDERSFQCLWYMTNFLCMGQPTYPLSVNSTISMGLSSWGENSTHRFEESSCRGLPSEAPHQHLPSAEHQQISEIKNTRRKELQESPCPFNHMFKELHSYHLQCITCSKVLAQVHIAKRILFCSTSLPQTNTRWFNSTYSSFLNSKKCRWLISASSRMNNSSDIIRQK